MLRWLRNIASQRQQTASLTLVDGRVVLKLPDRDEALSFRWDEVNEIVAFKRDLGTIDDIRLGFRVSGLWHDVSESDDGFLQLTDAMQEAFPTIPADWCLEVMTPPFETCETTLWRREPSATAG